MSACASNVSAPDDAPTEVRGISMAPELNRDTGSVVLPFDKFSLSENEHGDIVTASAAQRVACSREVGIPVGDPWPSLNNPAYDSESYFGPWTLAQARKFGFVEPASDADLNANGIVGAPELPSDRRLPEAPFADLTDEDGEKVEACNGPDEELFMSVLEQDGPWVPEIRAIRENAGALELPGLRDIVTELAACYKEKGITPGPKDLVWWPQGGKADRIDEQQIQLAVKVVDCKDSIEFTERMAAIEAREQAAVIGRYADELVQERATIEKALARADATIKQYDL